MQDTEGFCFTSIPSFLEAGMLRVARCAQPRHLHFVGLVRERAREVRDVVGRGGAVGHAAVAHARLVDRQRRQQRVYGLRVEAATPRAAHAELPVLPPPAARALE